MMLFYITGFCLALFQALKFCMRKYHASILSFVMKTVHSHIRPMKIKHFAEAFALVRKEGASGARLNVLEIGVGTGENFKFYPENTDITILDKTNEFREYYEESIRSLARPDLTISNLVVNHAENMSSIESNSMDAVLHTFFLCSVDDRSKVLSEINRVLKPGGVCVFIEHSADVKDKRRMLVQKCIESLFGDCCFINMRATIDSGVFDQVVMRDHFLPLVWLYFLNPIVYGYARKKSA
jgi:SAM-dependent methyltransferase